MVIRFQNRAGLLKMKNKVMQQVIKMKKVMMITDKTAGIFIKVLLVCSIILIACQVYVLIAL